jgi:hypothetical protein
MNEPPAILTREQAAIYLARSVETLRRWARLDIGPVFLKQSPDRQGRCLYRRSDLDAWVAAGCRLDRKGSRPAGLARFDPPSVGVGRGDKGTFVPKGAVT